MYPIKIDKAKISESFLLQFSIERICSLNQNTIITNSMKIDVKAELLNKLPETTVGNRIRKQRLLKEISQEELAKYISVADGTMDTYEFDRAFPSPKKLKKIAECLDVPVEYFFDEYYEFVFGDYGKKIRDWREKNKLFLKEAATLLNVSPVTLGRWKKKISYPDRVAYKKLVKLLKTYLAR